METVHVIVPSRFMHCSQIITGFNQLAMNKKQSYTIKFTDVSMDSNNEYYNTAFVFAEYKGKFIVYDTYDGYNAVEKSLPLLEKCDYYFKRSYSEEYNKRFFPNFEEKIFPLGFNYHVTYDGNPIDKHTGTLNKLKSYARHILGETSSTFFTSEVFESDMNPHIKHKHPKIIFLTRLWDPEISENGASLSTNSIREREYINDMRITIIRELRHKYGKNVVSGLYDNEVSKKYAPDLICDKKLTKRKHYLKLMHRSDVCIGSMGLHESIGWKTGEYVAAGKAIVNERFHYTVPGDFTEGKNYLSFSTVEECLEAVEKLVSSPELILEMKKSNINYYNDFLKPSQLVENTLKIVSNNSCNRGTSSYFM